MRLESSPSLITAGKLLDRCFIVDRHGTLTLLIVLDGKFSSNSFVVDRLLGNDQVRWSDFHSWNKMR